MLRAIREPPGHRVLWSAGVVPALCVFPSDVCECHLTAVHRPVQTYVITVSSPALASSVSLACLYSNFSGKKKILKANPLPSSPLLCRCSLCQTSLRNVLHVPRSQTRLIAKSQRGNPACRLQTPSMATITTITTVQALCDSGWHEAAACRPQTCVTGSNSLNFNLDWAVNS